MRKEDNIQNTNLHALEILDVIKTHHENAYRKVNEELVTMYFEIGKYLSQKVGSEKWGAKVIETISKEINKANPTLKGFDKRGLFRMMQFYETYKDNEIVSPLVPQISWTNNLIIFSHESSIEEKNLYQALYKEQLFQKRIRKTNIKPLLRKIAVSEYSTKLIDKKMLESKLIEFKDLLTK